MQNREFWTERIETAWRRRRIVWLQGVRRVGKTTLCQSLDDVEYLDCELPRTRRTLEDPETFLASVSGKRVVLDEIHRLKDPAEFLKIAADHYPTVRVLATGSSVIGASARFRDTLAGRKAEVWLTPICLADLEAFGSTNIRTRLERGGLPPFFLAASLPEADFQEWMDAYWSRDIQELFRLEKRHSFKRFVELVLSASGGIFDATRYARDCEISRQTAANYLDVLDATLVAHIVRPFSTRRATEILLAPKVYGFDTGFSAYYRGWHPPRAEDLGILWEQFVLNELHALRQRRDVRYWRDKKGHEIDFILAMPAADAPTAIECKWQAKEWDPTNLRVFRNHYPEGDSFVVANDVDRPYTRRVANHLVHVVSLRTLAQRLEAAKR